MRKLTLIIILGMIFLFTPPALCKKPLFYREDRNILPPYKQGEFDDTQRLSIQISSLINQGKVDKAAQILEILGSQKAATVLLSMKPQDAQRLLNFLDIRNVTSTFVQIAKRDANYAGIFFGVIVQNNPSLGARLYEKLAKERAILKVIFKTSVANEKILTSLLSAKNEGAKYIISTSGARRLLTDYARAEERDVWGNTEITALVNSGRGAEILFQRLIQKATLEMSDEERMKVLLTMKPKEAAKIIKNAYPEQAARLLVIMEPRQAAIILAQELLKPEEVKRIIREMDKQNKNITQDIVRELKILAPAKFEILAIKAQ
jgi:flagellar motility protein MotE (MotC chaperone)